MKAIKFEGSNYVWGAPKGMEDDVMFRADYAFMVNGVKYFKKYVTGRNKYEGEIKIQTADQIIEAKRNWVQKNVIWRAPQPQEVNSAIKHQADLKFIDMARPEKYLTLDNPDDDIDF